MMSGIVSMTGWTKAQFSVWHHQMVGPLSKIVATQLNGGLGVQPSVTRYWMSSYEITRSAHERPPWVWCGRPHRAGIDHKPTLDC